MLPYKRLFQTVLIYGAMVSVVNANEFRVWTHAESGQTARAATAAADFDAGTVTLVVADQSRKTVKIAELSAADIDYLQAMFPRSRATQLTSLLAGPVTIRGTVTDGTVGPSSQNGIRAVVVQAINENTSMVLARTQTDSDGKYSFQINEQPSGHTVLIEFVPERGYYFGRDINLKGELVSGSVQEINKVLRPITVIAQSSVFELQNAVRAPSASASSAQAPVAYQSAAVSSGCGQSAPCSAQSYQYKVVTRRCGLFRRRTYTVRVRVPTCNSSPQNCGSPCSCIPECSTGAVGGNSPVAAPQSIFTGKEAKRELKRVFDNLQFIEESLLRSELADDEATFGRSTVVRDRILEYLELSKGLPGIEREGTPMYDTVNEKLQGLRRSYGLSN